MKTFLSFISLSMLSIMGRAHLRVHDNVANEHVNITINGRNDTDNKFIGGTFQGPNANPPIQSGRPLSYDPSQIGN